MKGYMGYFVTRRERIKPKEQALVYERQGRQKDILPRGSSPPQNGPMFSKTPASFVKLNVFAESQCRDFGMDKKKVAGGRTGIGHGTIYGRTVRVF